MATRFASGPASMQSGIQRSKLHARGMTGKQFEAKHGISQVRIADRAVAVGMAQAPLGTRQQGLAIGKVAGCAKALALGYRAIERAATPRLPRQGL